MSRRDRPSVTVNTQEADRWQIVALLMGITSIIVPVVVLWTFMTRHFGLMWLTFLYQGVHWTAWSILLPRWSTHPRDQTARVGRVLGVVGGVGMIVASGIAILMT